LDRELFEGTFLPKALLLEKDKVVNVRLGLSMLLNYLSTSEFKGNELIETTLTRMNSDKDKDVSYFSHTKSAIPRKSLFGDKIVPSNLSHSLSNMSMSPSLSPSGSNHSFSSSEDTPSEKKSDLITLDESTEENSMKLEENFPTEDKLSMKDSLDIEENILSNGMDIDKNEKNTSDDILESDKLNDSKEDQTLEEDKTNISNSVEAEEY